MGFAYTIKDQGAVYFVTFTVHQWVDDFTRSVYVDEPLANLQYCQEHKGLEIFTWVVMSNHLHVIVRTKNENLSDVIRGLKSIQLNQSTDTSKESRKDWLTKVLRYEGKIWFWEEGYHGEEV